jgi:outer membrane protein assembly factor BamE (lipoprotein component of BamABCDE complex)
VKFIPQGQFMTHSADFDPDVAPKKGGNVRATSPACVLELLSLPFAFFGLLLVLVACGPLVRTHGYVPNPSEIALIEIGTDTRESVAEKIGRPSIQSLLTEDGWYYVQTNIVQVGPKAPVEQGRQVLVISFDAKGIVANVAEFGQTRGQIVVLSSRVTQSDIRGVSFLRQLMGNAGRVNAADILGN